VAFATPNALRADGPVGCSRSESEFALCSLTVTSGSRQGPGAGDHEPSGATEPITLTDPDGAVTRVAPWSSWTREQVRAPGGEPALVTRLDQGQLWFSAGRRRSPWRHEVHVGPAVVSTPRGRFQAVAESDGGATISCLAGRTRVVAGLREPVLLGPDQSAAVSSDGRTLVVMDRASADVGTEPAVIDLTDGALEAEAAAEALAAERARVGAGVAAGGPAAGTPLRARADEDDEVPAAATATSSDGDDVARPRAARLGWIPEAVAVAALVGVLLAVVLLFARGDDTDEAAAPVTPELPATTAAPTTTEAETEIDVPATTDAPTTSAAPTTTTPPPTASGASARGELGSCRRSDGGVIATVVVSHRGGPASRFTVQAALVDAGGAAFATGSATTGLIEPGSSSEVEVLVPFEGRPEGACELEGVTAA
jgi:hypothetical protein